MPARDWEASARGKGAAIRASLAHAADSELIVQIATRDGAALAELFGRHRGPAHALARRVCRRPELADDALQEALIAIWRDASRFTPGIGTPAAWVHTIVRNRSVDVMRKARTSERRQTDDNGALDAIASIALAPDEAACGRERERLVACALAQLSSAQREVVELAFFEGLSHAEIAARLALPLGTVKGRARLALKRLACDPALAALAC